MPQIVAVAAVAAVVVAAAETSAVVAETFVAAVAAFAAACLLQEAGETSVAAHLDPSASGDVAFPYPFPFHVDHTSNFAWNTFLALVELQKQDKNSYNIV